jgi:hypothetical protein
MVTHELRNPLNAIAGWLHLLSNAPGATAGPAPALATRAAAGLRRAVDEQLEQVETLGRVLRLAGGEPDEAAGSVDLADLLQSQVDLIRTSPQAEGRAVELELGAKPGGARWPVVVGNADAHGKNFSILYGSDGPRLAPLYDLLATVAYPELSPQLAMRIGKRATLGEMDPRGWSAFAADAGVGLPLIRRRVSEISQAVIARAHDVADEVMLPGLDEAALSQVSAMAVKRAELCAVTTYD